MVLELCWSRPEVSILSADQKDRGFWGRECRQPVVLTSLNSFGGLQVEKIYFHGYFTCTKTDLHGVMSIDQWEFAGHRTRSSA